MADEHDLFGADEVMQMHTSAKEHALNDSADKPLAARMRPRSLKEVVGQDHILKADSLLPRLVAQNNFGSLICWG